MFTKILIANRGEIACRVMRTCQAMGIATVAVHSEADADAMHVRMADEAVNIGPAPVAQSYLNREAIVDAALRLGAQAIHPGYGLLSEDAEFVRLCEERGVTFIGPSAAAMLAIGHKLPARERARAAGVPVVPGMDVSLDAENVAAIAEQVGLPLILKASAGGGGIGMTVVKNVEELEKALGRAKSTAERIFGDATVYAERYLASARHVEVQIFGTEDGALHLFHRDCSTQRRHQKVIEEAPAPGISPALTEAITGAALRLADSIGYRNAGTVEFLVSSEEFFFLEVNARLQVEHPVTEETTGLDLVEAQIRLAAGESLGWRQQDIRPTGHAIECRIYAEDPRNGMPSPGTIETAIWPAGEGVRVDTGYESGDKVTPYYDPMIAKLIVRGDSRAHAIERLEAALAECEITGLKTNLPSLRAIASFPEFREGAFDTGILGRLAAG